jgi:hypothetical protein
MMSKLNRIAITTRPRSTTGAGAIILDEGVSTHVQSTPAIALVDSGAGPGVFFRVQMIWILPPAAVVPRQQSRNS